MSETHCPSCGYTKRDAQIHGDHNLCKNAGKAPWERKSQPSPSRPQAETRDWMQAAADELASQTHSWQYVHSCIKRHYEAAQPSSHPEVSPPVPEGAKEPLCVVCSRARREHSEEPPFDNDICDGFAYGALKGKPETAPVDELEQRVKLWFHERNKSDLLPHEKSPAMNRYPSGIDTSGKLFKAVAELLRAELAAERQRVIEECCKAVCHGCHNDVLLDEATGLTWHRPVNGTGYQCNAVQLRKLGGQQ